MNLRAFTSENLLKNFDHLDFGIIKLIKNSLKASSIIV